MLEPVSTTFLAGKVRQWSLPVVQAPSGADAPRLKRLLLPQGELAQFYDGEEGIRYIAMIQLRPGNPRGNHYHKVKQEFLYLMEGEVLLLVEDLETRQRASVPLHGGDLAFIPTRIAHALQVLQPGFAVEFSAARFDPADIYRMMLTVGI
ncbi:MAG TPA: cupin domain-containing protein [Candidatus Binatia bacterium]|jgi:hypothetical protein|nr:cupin domain-containing protein [Candidatus Binatia bacterium]